MQLFAQVCQIFHRAAEEYPLAKLLLSVLASAARQSGVPLPEESAPHFSGLQIPPPQHESVSLGFVVPVFSRLTKLEGKEGPYSAAEVGIELADLVGLTN